MTNVSVRIRTGSDIAHLLVSKRWLILIPLALGVAAAPFYDALLRRQQRGHQSNGLTFALEADNQYDALLATYHWILPYIEQQTFVALYQKFLTAALAVIADVDTMIDKTKNVQRIHPKQG